MRNMGWNATDALNEAAAMTESLTLVKAAVLNPHSSPEEVLRGCSKAIASLRIVQQRLTILREHYTTKAADQAHQGEA